MNEAGSKQEDFKEILRPSMMVVVNERATKTAYVLLIQRNSQASQPNLWEFPGGKQEGDTLLSETVINEVRQETGIDVPMPRLQIMTLRQRLGIEQVVTEKEKLRKIRFVPYFYEVTLDNLPLVTLSEEHEDYLWLELPGVNYDNEVKDNAAHVHRSTRATSIHTAFMTKNDSVDTNSVTFTETTGLLLSRYLLMDSDFDYMPQVNPLDPDNFTHDLLQEKYH